MKTVIELQSGASAWVADDGQPTPLGLVVSEHVDKIGFFEPTVRIVEKELLKDRIRFVLLHNDQMSKSLDEILRGYRIGCFRIALEYGLITPANSAAIFAPDAVIHDIEPERQTAPVHIS